MTASLHETADSIQKLVARDVMTQELATVGGSSTVGEALTVMRRWGVRHLPVTDDDGCFVGLVDDRLVTRALLTGPDRESAFDEPVEQAMTRYVPQVAPDTPVSRVSRLLRTSRCDAVAVVDARDRLLGLITLVDVVGAVANGAVVDTPVVQDDVEPEPEE